MAVTLIVTVTCDIVRLGLHRDIGSLVNMLVNVELGVGDGVGDGLTGHLASTNLCSVVFLLQYSHSRRCIRKQRVVPLL